MMETAENMSGPRVPATARDSSIEVPMETTCTEVLSSTVPAVVDCAELPSSFPNSTCSTASASVNMDTVVEMQDDKSMSLAVFPATPASTEPPEPSSGTARSDVGTRPKNTEVRTDEKSKPLLVSSTTPVPSIALGKASPCKSIKVIDLTSPVKKDDLTSPPFPAMPGTLGVPNVARPRAVSMPPRVNSPNLVKKQSLPLAQRPGSAGSVFPTSQPPPVRQVQGLNPQPRLNHVPTLPPSLPALSNPLSVPRLVHPAVPSAVSSAFGNDPLLRAAILAKMAHLTPAQRQALQASGVLNQMAPTPGLNEQGGDELKKIADEDVEGKLSDEVFAGYKHNNILKGCKAHPGDIVEAGSLASIPLPKATYGLDAALPEQVISTGQLSSLQLEGIMYACQRHQLVLPNGTRAGFFIGDGAGVGKGRQISGIVVDNFCRGRTKHIWFSTSTDLIIDAKRDLSDIGCHVKVIEGCRQLDRETRIFGLPSDFKEGVIFSTYATLVSSVQRGTGTNASKHSRLQQLIDWCGGKAFDGCLVFDECHKAKNFVPGKESSSTKVALAVSQIQRLLPKARVVYCSATGVTDVKNMAFMERLGLWGDGAPFRSFDKFLDSIHKRGLGVAEMLAMEMKATGMYVSRGLSFKQAEFVTIEATLTPDQVKVYDTAAHLWNEMRKALDNALIRTKSSNSRVWSSFWASHQRFFKQLCMGMKVPTIVEHSNEAIANGCCVVIGLQTTGEASLENERIQNDFRISGFVSLCREIFTRFIEIHFPTFVEGVGHTDASGLYVRVRDDWCVAAKTRLLEFAKMIELPNSPLDEIIDKLGGPDTVAEMTGRRARIVRRNPQDRPQYELRDSDNSGGLDSLNVRERNLFMEGKKFVAIISDAASTGISLHADTRVGNTRRRVHLTIELPWSADKAVQQLGRSHRSNQSSGPLYKLVTTNLGGERRFASAVARRLLSLGALTKGDRRAATGQDLSQFNFDSPYGRTALRTMYHAICKKEMVQGIDLKTITDGKCSFDEFISMAQESLLLIGVVDQTCLISGMSLSVREKEVGDVGRFLNRILGLRVDKQNMMFRYFSECLESAINSAKKEGRYNEGLLDITAASIEMVGSPKEVFKEAAVGDGVTKLVTLNVDRGMSWEAAKIRLENYGKKDDGFYKSKREIFGRRLYILATQKESSDHVFRIARPNTGLSGFDEEKADIFEKYKKIEAEDAEKGWKSHYENTKDHCMHGPHCKVGPTCHVGSRCYKMHLLTGCIVTLLNVLETTLTKYQSRFQFSHAEKNLRVVRVQLDDGERVVGVRFPDVLLPYAEQGLKEQKIIETVQARQTSLSQGSLSQMYSQTTDADVTKNLQSIVEPESIVVPKLQTRAMTPPVTLKSFFKPVTKAESRESFTQSKPKLLAVKTESKSNEGLGNHFKTVSKSESWDSFGKGTKSTGDSPVQAVDISSGSEASPVSSSQEKLSKSSRPESRNSETRSCFSQFKPVPKDEIWKTDSKAKPEKKKGEDEDWSPEDAGSSDSEDCFVVEVHTPSTGKGKKRKNAGKGKQKGKKSTASAKKKKTEPKKTTVIPIDDDSCCAIIEGENGEKTAEVPNDGVKVDATDCATLEDESAVVSPKEPKRTRGRPKGSKGMKRKGESTPDKDSPFLSVENSGVTAAVEKPDAVAETIDSAESSKSESAKKRGRPRKAAGTKADSATPKSKGGSAKKKAVAPKTKSTRTKTSAPSTKLDDADLEGDALKAGSARKKAASPKTKSEVTKRSTPSEKQDDVDWKGEERQKSVKKRGRPSKPSSSRDGTPDPETWRRSGRLKSKCGKKTWNFSSDEEDSNAGDSDATLSFPLAGGDAVVGGSGEKVQTIDSLNMDLESPSPSPLVGNDSPTVLTVEKSSAVDTVNKSSPAATVEDKFTCVDTANKSPSADSENDSPTVLTVEKSSSMDTVNKSSPAATVEDKFTCVDTANKSPSADSENDSPTVLTVEKSSSMDTVNKSSPAATVDDKVTCVDTVNKSPSADRENDSPTVLTVEKSSSVDTVNTSSPAATVEDKSTCADTANKSPSADRENDSSTVTVEKSSSVDTVNKSSPAATVEDKSTCVDTVNKSPSADRENDSPTVLTVEKSSSVDTVNKSSPAATVEDKSTCEDTANKSPSADSENDSPTVLTVEKSSSVDTVNKSSPAATVEDEFTCVDTANKSPSADSVNELPTADTVHRSPTADTVNKSPTAGTVNKSPTAGTVNKSPTAGTVNTSPTAGTVNKSPTAGTVNKSPTAGTVNKSPTAGTVNKSPTVDTMNKSPNTDTVNSCMSPGTDSVNKLINVAPVNDYADETLDLSETAPSCENGENESSKFTKIKSDLSNNNDSEDSIKVSCLSETGHRVLPVINGEVEKSVCPDAKEVPSEKQRNRKRRLSSECSDGALSKKSRVEQSSVSESEVCMENGCDD